MQGVMRIAKPDDITHIYHDCENLLSILTFLNKLQDSVPWQYYAKCVQFLVDEIKLHTITYSLLLSIKINGHCYYLRDIFQAIQTHIKSFDTFNIIYITSQECQQQHEIQTILHHIDLSKQIKVHFNVDQKILGGFKLIANNIIYDYSIATIIEQAREQIDTQLDMSSFL